MSTLHDGHDAADDRDGPVAKPFADPGPQPGQVAPQQPTTDPQAYDDRA